MKTVLATTALLLCLFSLSSADHNLLQGFDVDGLAFTEFEIGNRYVVYFHQRMIGDAIVEKDYIVYRFDQETHEFLERKSHWREDVPVDLPLLRLTRENAGALTPGDVQFGKLYIISPDSDVFPLDSTPENPCWVMRSVDQSGVITVSIFDAVTGAFLGNGVPPPYTAFSITGPINFNPCSWGWHGWAESAESWFNTMGYTAEYVVWPSNEEFRSHVQSDETAVLYEIAHSDDYVGYAFESGCVNGNDMEIVTAGYIRSWIADYEKMPFTFLASCYSMCETEENRLSYEFRKGEKWNTATIGYCGMSDPVCDSCWGYSLNWQNALFGYLAAGYTVGEAFDMTSADFPACSGPNCMRQVGGGALTLVPPLVRMNVDRLVPDEYPTIQAAVDASNRGDIIRVASGVYTENVVLPSYAALYGGYDPTFTARDPEAYPTIIDGGYLDHTVSCENADHVAVDGFEIRASGSSHSGVYAWNGQPTVRNCTIYDCNRGIEIAYGTGNPAEGDPVIEHCEIRDNTETGVYVYESTHDAVHIERNTIHANGGLGIYSSGSSMQILSNTIAFNGSAGGIQIGDGSAVIRNNIITDNEGYGIFCAGTVPNVTYNDVWNNSTLDYSGCSGGAGSISEDPVYCDAAAGDVSVHASSPTLGAGEHGVNMGALGVGCPEGPQDLAVVQSGASLVISWSTPPWARVEVDHYVVYRDTTLVPETVIGLVDAPDTVFIDITTLPCEAFNYWVTAVDSDTLEGALSNRATGEVCYEGPSDLSAMFSEGANELSWSHGSGPIDYYVIQRGNEVASPDSIGWATASDSAFVDTAVADCPRDNYTYEITPVYDTGWRGVPSAAVSIDPAPSPPSGITAEWIGNDVLLNWDDNCESDFRRYWVYRDTIPFSPPIDGDRLVGFTPDPTFLDEGLSPGSTYFYRLVATDATAQKSVYSNTVYVGSGDVLSVPSPYGTIQAAIDASAALDTVLVSPGTYNESITLRDAVVVMSSDGRATTTIASSSVVVTALGVCDLTHLSGFTIDGQGIAPVGVDCWMSCVTVEDCSIINCTNGVSAKYGDASMFSGNRITANSNGVAVADSAAPFLCGNVIDLNTFAGIYNTGDPGPEVGHLLADANDIMDNAFFQVFNAAGITVDADYNYWGGLCVGDSLFYGSVNYTPWTDETHTETYTECDTDVDGPAAGRPYLSHNFPNPFNPSTAIRYRVPSVGGLVTLTVHDLSGRTVRTLVDAYKSGGEHMAVWHCLDELGRHVGSGVYFYRLEVGGVSIERKMVMVK